MPKKKYGVDLSAEERTTLEQLVQRGKNSARKLTRAGFVAKFRWRRADLSLYVIYAAKA